MGEPLRRPYGTLMAERVRKPGVETPGYSHEVPPGQGLSRERLRHQAVAGCVEAETLVALAEEFDVRRAVVINEENILVRLWRIAALNNVVRLLRNDDSAHARHAHTLPLAGRKVNK